MTTPLPGAARKSSHHVTAMPSRAAYAGYAAAWLTLVIVFLLHFIKGTLDPAAHMLSEYALAPHGWMMQLAFCCWALGCCTLAFTLRHQVATRAGRIGIVLLFIASAALLMGSLFVIDDPYAPASQPSFHGMLHGISAMIGLPGQAIAGLLISYSLRKNPDWGPFSKPIVLFAHLTWISLLAMFVSTFVMMSNGGGQFNGSTGIGWFNRGALLMYCGWLLVTAQRAILLLSHT